MDAKLEEETERMNEKSKERLTQLCDSRMEKSEHSPKGFPDLVTGPSQVRLVDKDASKDV